MKKVVKKILIYLTIFIFILLIIRAFFISIKNSITHDVIFTLNGDKVLTLSLNEKYNEQGAKVTIDGTEEEKEITIDSSKLDITTPGKYKIKYSIILNKREYSDYREVNVIDDLSPVITLNGSEVINIIVGETYKEPGLKCIDNYDGDITDKVETIGEVNNKSEGEYIIKYQIKDTSGNETIKERKIIVKKPNVIVYENKSENKEVVKKVEPTKYPNTITSNKFLNNGFSISGYLEKNNGTFILKLVGDTTYTFDMTNTGNNNYSANIDLSNVPIGKYDLVISSIEEEKLLNKMSYITKINRAKVLDKLVTFSYNNDEVSLNIEPFAYLYDVLIDPGHGGSDTGASNKYMYEKDMNLKVSMYEKCRYESHGLKVYMTRTTDTYGNGLGSDPELSRLHRRAYEVGYYGVVSKIAYSNHHNSSGSPNLVGYEILLPGNIINIDSEISIAMRFNSLYNLTESHNRFYAKDYNTEVMYSKLGKQVYTFKDNYAINRIPYEVFNTKAIIYEGIYMSNDNDFNWYWNESNWIKVSEIKISEYIKSLGLSYNSDNSSCL